MNRHPWPAPFLLVVAVTLGLHTMVTPTAGQTVTMDTLSLLELPGVMVVVEPIPDDARNDGLDPDSLRGLIETKLRDGGITVYTEDEWQVTIGNPLLRIRFNLVHPSEFFYLYAVETQLQQLVVLARDSTLPAFATTWSAGSAVGTVPSGNLPALHHEVLRQVDRFLGAYSAAARYGRRMLRAPRRPQADGPSPRWDGVGAVGSLVTRWGREGRGVQLEQREGIY